MIISENSYLILWLNSDIDEKSLNKRHKELLNFLNIDEVWSYENDFPFIDYKKIRTEENIKEAFHNLSNQHKKLYQTFFRFQLVDDKDEESMSDIIDWNYVEWSNKWLELFNKTNKYHYLKNHMIWELLFYENKNKFKDLSFTEVPTIIADLLHKLINSDSFWKEFKEIFNIQNEIAIRDDMIESLKNELPQFIAEHFFDFSEEIWNSKLYKEFSKKFGISAKELDDNKNVTEPIKHIETTLKSIKEMDLWEELDDIIDWINEITWEIKKLDRLWLKLNPKIIKLKDEFAREVRSIAISLCNDYNDLDNSINFIEEAIKIAKSNNLKEKFHSDLKDIKKINKTKEQYEQKTKYLLRKPVPMDELDLPISYVKELIKNWGKFIVFLRVFSFLIYSKKESTKIYFIPPWVSYFSAAIEPTITTLFLWWRSISWFFWTIEAIFTNLFWGKNLTSEIMRKF